MNAGAPKLTVKAATPPRMKFLRVSFTSWLQRPRQSSDELVLARAHEQVEEPARLVQ